MVTMPITEARTAPRRTAGTMAARRGAGTTGPAVAVMVHVGIGLASRLSAARGTALTKPSRLREVRHAEGTGDRHGGKEPWTWISTDHASSSINAGCTAHHQ
jgi:hypothetical protein